MASQGPNLTPTLQIYYRPELIKHISDWGVERLERDVSFYWNFFSSMGEKTNLFRAFLDSKV